MTAPEDSALRVPRVLALDGLRLLAALAVVVYHVGQPYRDFRGGAVGVDVFFSISGFVITRLLLHEWQTGGRISLRRFYRARFYRLMPALTAMAVVVTVADVLDRSFRSDARFAPFALFYVMDIARAAVPVGQYVSGTLGHTWSLGVEEQFYLVWPVVLVFLLRRRLGGHRLLGVAAILTGYSAFDGVTLLGLNGANLNRVYNAPDTRAVELLAGCTLAIALHHAGAGGVARRTAAVCRVGMWPAAGVLVWSCLRPYYSAAPEQGVGFALKLVMWAACGALLVGGLACAPRNPLTRALALPWLARWGTRYSYSLYLWQLPVAGFVHVHLHPGFAASVGIVVPVSIGLSWLSAKFVEDPFNNRRRRTSRSADDVPAETPAGELRQAA